MNAKLLREFKEYTDSYDSADPKIALKIEHTYKVADIAEEIARSIQETNENDVDFCWLLGLLHDIGRFEQVRRYGTFSDAQSIDHAELGADILFKDGLINRFWSGSITGMDPEEELKIIELSIRQHNKLSLPDSLSDKERMFCDILRDSDKVDIFRVFCEIPLELKKTMLEDGDISPASEEVMQCVREHRCVSRPSIRTAFEAHISRCAMVFELVYPKSRELATSQGFLDQILSYEPHSEEQKTQMEELRESLGKVLLIN